MDQDATRAGDDTQVVDGGVTAPSVDERHPQAPGTICAAMRCVAKARMPWPYCSGPGISSGKEPRLSARQCGQVVISAATAGAAFGAISA